MRGEVEFDHVDFDYVEDVPVLRDINLHVQPGRDDRAGRLHRRRQDDA